jgi:hypothetical protein
MTRKKPWTKKCPWTTWIPRNTRLKLILVNWNRCMHLKFSLKMVNLYWVWLFLWMVKISCFREFIMAVKTLETLQRLVLLILDTSLAWDPWNREWLLFKLKIW